MTTYAVFMTGENPLKHGEYQGKTLVLGWMTTAYNETDELTETRYALHIDGRVMKTNPQRYDHSHFNDKKTEWHPIENVPADAQFIGNYVDDIFHI